MNAALYTEGGVFLKCYASEPCYEIQMIRILQILAMLVCGACAGEELAAKWQKHVDAAEAAAARGNDDDAIRELLAAKEVGKKIATVTQPFDMRKRAEVERLLALSYLNKKDAPTATVHARVCVALLNEVHEEGGTEVSAGYVLLARVLFFAHREDDADAALKKAIKICDDAGEKGREQLLETLNEAHGFYQTAERENERRAVEERLEKLRTNP